MTKILLIVQDFDISILSYKNISTLLNLRKNILQTTLILVSAIKIIFKKYLGLSTLSFT